MEFITVRDLRTRPGQIWDKLRRQRDLILTSNGRPIAVLSHIEEGRVEDTLALLRRCPGSRRPVRRRDRGRDRRRADRAPGTCSVIVVVDTDVLVSGLLSAHGRNGRQLYLVDIGGIVAQPQSQ
jgi:antitoxin (DNA-binding transcriptional repressor) of toxin-antitoxin stability system